tara:strand:- start:113779 stop:113952 length:174 start_codon:yes stop_codon:yes gene_type:complete
MEVIVMLIPLALILGAIFLGLFIWATRDHQFEDLKTPASRILLDDTKVNIKNSEVKK